jgi:hypothetical protein
MRRRDREAAALWFTGPKSFTALAARDRRELLTMLAEAHTAAQWNANMLADAQAQLAALQRNEQVWRAEWEQISATAAALQREYAASAARVDSDNRLLRMCLAFAYSGSALYGDDGELQDNSMQPFIDYRRDSVAQIQEAMQERGLRKLEAALAQPDAARAAGERES